MSFAHNRVGCISEHSDDPFRQCELVEDEIDHGTHLTRKDSMLQILPSEKPNLDDCVEDWRAGEQHTWREITEDKYYEYLGAVPPLRQFGKSFLMGEAYLLHMYFGFVEHKGRFFAKLCNVSFFNTDVDYFRNEFKAAMVAQIKAYEEIRNAQPTGYLWPDPNHIFDARRSLNELA